VSDDVIIAGGGLVGLCAAAALARKGVRCTIVSERRAGEASPAAAGMLAPGVEHAEGAAHRFGLAAREFYPEFLTWLGSVTGVAIPLDRAGIIQVAATPEDAARLRAEAGGDARWLTADEVRQLEPALIAGAGALHHTRDGAVNNEALVAALREHVAKHPLITSVSDAIESIQAGTAGAAVLCASGRQYAGSSVILATGAWTGALKGLPRTIPVEPVRGQMLELAGAPVRHVAFAGGGYLVPRAAGTTLIGSTMERVGFDVTITGEARAHLLGVASAASPSLGAAPVLRHWAGLRPLTPDMQPVVGRDPDAPALVYACGHSRNGILMAPLTGEVAATLATGGTPSHDLSAFSPTRF